MPEDSGGEPTPPDPAARSEAARSAEARSAEARSAEARSPGGCQSGGPTVPGGPVPEARSREALFPIHSHAVRYAAAAGVCLPPARRGGAGDGG